MATTRRLALAAALGATFMASSQAATHSEVGDAGQTQTSAQLTGVGPLTSIFGSVKSSTDVDLFVIYISNPATFSATTNNAYTGLLDTQLFLLTLAGAPVYINDDDASGTTFASTLPAGSMFGPLTAGNYLLGVSLALYDPTNGGPANQLLFASSGDTTSTRGPASGLQPAVLGGYADNGYFPDAGQYEIQLTGATAVIPEPSTTALMLLGGALCAGMVRRRRSADTATATAAV